MAKPCPECKKPSPPIDENPAFPFCGQRCQNVDLSRWLGAEYVISSPLINPAFMVDLPPGAHFETD